MDQIEKNLRADAPLYEDIQKFWPDLKENNFWKYEYLKHGTCAVSQEGVADPVQFFRETIKLRKSVDLLSGLTNANITPGSSYSVNDVYAALKQVTGTTLQLGCNEDVLTEIRICVNRHFEFIDCADNGKDSTKRCPAVVDILSSQEVEISDQ